MLPFFAAMRATLLSHGLNMCASLSIVSLETTAAYAAECSLGHQVAYLKRLQKLARHRSAITYEGLEGCVKFEPADP